MAINYEYALTNSRGMKKVVSFEGLAFPILIAPTLHGEPLLTAQAIYYLNRLESAVRVRFEDPMMLPKHRSNKERERWFEYIIDNYLFEYSKRYPYEQLTSKITDLKYWKNDGHTYIGYDENNTQALALDTLNDQSVLEVSNEDLPSIEHWNDWRLVSNYTDEYIATYVKSMTSVLSKTVKVKTNGHDELGTGEFELPLILPQSGVLNYYQACMLEVLQPNRIKVVDGSILVSRGMSSTDNFTLPFESIKASKYYDADLLSYYFAAVREDLPISRFRCFYNVIEYFFEDAPKHLGETAKTEREQISCVLRWVTDSLSLDQFIRTLGQNFVTAIEQELLTSSGERIKAIKIASLDLGRVISEWIYAIRCAIVHSKKTRKGNIEARLVPYSEDEELAALAVPIIQHLAVLCIDKDGEVKV